MHLLPLVVAVAAVSAGAPAKDPACAELVRFNSARLESSAVMELQMQLQAYQTTKLFLDAISANPKIGPAWREGNPFWEEAYALLHPDILEYLKGIGARELRRQEENVPRKLDAKTCREYVALLHTPHGELTARIDQATQSSEMLARFEKQFPIPARLAPFAQKAHDEIAAGAALRESAEVKSQEALYRKTHEQLRAYDKRVLAAVKAVGDSQGPDDQEAGRAFGQELTKRHQQELVSIFKRYAAAKPN